jgi:hypothetical protein
MGMILWPAVITLAITILRVVGELQGWSKSLFNPEPGGGGALVGISWLPLLLGGYFAWKLSKAGSGTTSPWKAAGLSLLSFALLMGIGVGMEALKLGQIAQIAIFGIGSLAVMFLPLLSWPALGRTLLAYGLAARIPVAVLMLFAISGNWGTHYDVLPTDAPATLTQAGTLLRWFWIGLVPQLTVWIAFTVIVGTLVGSVVVALGKPRSRGSVAAQ